MIKLLLLILLTSAAAGVVDRPPNVIVDPKIHGGSASDNKATVGSAPRPVTRQKRKEFRFEDQGVAFSNDFTGSRANRVSLVKPGVFEVFSEMENHPINDSGSSGARGGRN